MLCQSTQGTKLKKCTKNKLMSMIKAVQAAVKAVSRVPAVCGWKDLCKSYVSA